MALMGTNKRRSVDQEDRIAAQYGGKRSLSSGAADTDSGDVALVNELIECKTTGGPGEKPTRVPAFVKELAKVVEEARERNRTGVLAMRFYSPDHYLANRDGWIEITIRPTVDDVARGEQIRDLEVNMEILDAELSECKDSGRLQAW